MSNLDLQLTNPLPEWLPGETLFSLLSRFHRLSGHRLAADTCQVLFGSAHGGCAHDFPNRLGTLCERVQDALGAPVDLARDKTLLPFFLPLQTLEAADAAIASLVGAPSGVLKFRLGILTSRFRANHPLKACPECMKADRGLWGTSYWHSVHQLPGVWLCPIHRAELLECDLKSTGVHRFGWVLPEAARLRRSAPALHPAGMAALARLAELATGWGKLPPGALASSDRLAATYQAQVHRRFGHAALSTSERQALSASFACAIAPLRIVPELQAFPESPREAWSQIHRWVLAPRGGTHPLRHLAIIFWLYLDWNEFLASYEVASVNQVERGAGDPQPPAVTNGLIGSFLAAVQDGLSISAASRSIGITPNTGMAWAARHGIEIRRRPKVLAASTRAILAKALRSGADKTELATREDVSLQSLTRILQTEPGLRDAWNAARKEGARERAREAWTSASKRLRGLPPSLLRREEPAAYAWLYRNDRAWLEEHRPSSRSARSANALRVDWDRRDLELSASVQRVAAELAATEKGDRLELWQLYQRIPELKAKLGALDRLPLTLRVIQAVTGRRLKGSSRPLL